MVFNVSSPILLHADDPCSTLNLIRPNKRRDVGVLLSLRFHELAEQAIKRLEEFKPQADPAAGLEESCVSCLQCCSTFAALVLGKSEVEHLKKCSQPEHL